MELRKKEKEQEFALKQKEEELESLRRNYDRVLRILQNRKYENHKRLQSNSWKNELVKRNQELQEKQNIIMVRARALSCLFG